jgi:hypothetical protein
VGSASGLSKWVEQVGSASSNSKSKNKNKNKNKKKNKNKNNNKNKNKDKNKSKNKSMNKGKNAGINTGKGNIYIVQKSSGPRNRHAVKDFCFVLQLNLLRDLVYNAQNSDIAFAQYSKLNSIDGGFEAH